MSSTTTAERDALAHKWRMASTFREENGGESFTALLQRTALAASKLGSLPPPPPPGASQQSQQLQQQQDPATDVLAQLERLARLAESLSLISLNESLRDISTPSLRALFLPSLTAEVLTRQRTPPPAASGSGSGSGAGAGAFDGRKKVLQAAVAQARSFLAAVTKLNILPASTLSLLGARNELLTGGASASASGSSSNAGSADAAPTFLPSAGVSASAAQSRQLKIALFKLERSLGASLDAYRQEARARAAARRRTGVRAPVQGLSAGPTSGAESALPVEAAPEEAFYDLLVLGADAPGSGRDADDDDEEEDEEDDDDGKGRSGPSASPSSADVPIPTSLRSYLLLLLNFHALKSYALLESATQELTLLANMPPPPPASEALDRRREAEARDSTWRLDTPLGGGLTSGPLLDPKGRPLRPFTITPSTASSAAGSGQLVPDNPTAKREVLRAQVFQPSHRLPTMSIDEYLAEEERRGNVLRGGGPEGAAKPTPKEERAIRAEMDGTREGEEAEAEERAEKIKWDNWADEHRRGEGNTMNRG
ncbi:Type 2A phosphatase-associated protein 42 [Tilletia horrida]|nr:Type 2A phosphatase-associated protein 42 [Tilletia horrida]